MAGVKQVDPGLGQGQQQVAQLVGRLGQDSPVILHLELRKTQGNRHTVPHFTTDGADHSRAEFRPSCSAATPPIRATVGVAPEEAVDQIAMRAVNGYPIKTQGDSIPRGSGIGFDNVLDVLVPHRFCLCQRGIAVMYRDGNRAIGGAPDTGWPHRGFARALRNAVRIFHPPHWALVP